MTGPAGDLRSSRESNEVFPLLALTEAPPSRLSWAETPNKPQQSPYQQAAYVSYALRTADAGSRKLTAVYGSMATSRASKATATATPRPTESDALLGGDPHSNQSETESDSDGSCTAASSSASSLQSILRIPSCRSIKKQVSVEFALDIGSDEDDDSKRGADGSCASRCMPRRLTIEEKAALYQVRPDLELVPSVLLLSELEEMRRRRQRKLMFSVLGASLIMLLMLVFYYLVSQM